MRGRIYAWANLGARFGVHLLKLPVRAFRKGAGLRRLLEAVVPEGYVPLDAEQRERLPASMRCVSCGLCALACEDLRDAPHSAWEEPWTFVVGPSRSIDFAPLAAASAPACDVDHVCPMRVAISGAAATVSELAARGMS